MEAFDRLLQAIEDCDVLAVRQLVAAHPALLEQTDEYGCTALMDAVSCPSRDVAVIREFLDAGAKVNWQTVEGYTALHCAIDVNFEANLNSREVLTLLIDAGADLTLKQHYGWTPLLRAVVEGTPMEVDTLLSAGANPNETLPQDTLPAFNAGHTTLMAALPTCDSEAKIESLLLAGADLRARDANGATFFDYCADLLGQYPEGEFAEKIIRCREMALKFDHGAS
ncbi:MAG: hypothetical protein JWP89_3499 [Schlesneria sp.]|nr:hypothetical protein [Schlesneria sp.]